MKRFFLIMCLLMPNWGWAENIIFDWPDREFKRRACIVNINPSDYFYQHTFQIAAVVFDRHSSHEVNGSIFYDGVFYYALWPVGNSVMKDQKVGSMNMIIANVLENSGSWVEMPSCP